MINMNNNASQSRIFEHDGLPKELKVYISSFLSPRDLQSAVQVNTTVKNFFVETTKQTEIDFLQAFGKFIKIQNNDQIEDICSIGIQNLSKCYSLTALKWTNEEVKDQIIDVLQKNVEQQDFPTLKAGSKNLIKSHCFHNVIYLAALYQEIEKTENLEHIPTRDQAFADLSALLSKKGGNLSKAIEVASRILDETLKEKTFALIGEKKLTPDPSPSKKLKKKLKHLVSKISIG